MPNTILPHMQSPGVDEQNELWRHLASKYEHRRFYPLSRNHRSQEGKWHASKKSDTLLWSEVGLDDLFIYHLFFSSTSASCEKSKTGCEENQTFILHPLNIACGLSCNIFVFSWLSVNTVFHTPGGGSRKQKDFLRNGADTDTSYVTHPWDTSSV